MSLKEQLERPFPAKAISWRVGSTNGDKTSGMALAYIDSRDVMKRLDDVCGIGGWQDSYVETPKGRVICTLGLLVQNPFTNEPSWIYKSDGAGETDVEGDKGAISDAFKRAAVKWGIGRYLYSLPSPWVEIDSHRRIIKDPILPEWATPEGYDALLAKRKSS